MSQKEKKNWKNYLPVILGMVMGLGAGVASGILFAGGIQASDGKDLVVVLFMSLLSAIAAFFLQVFFHESGHLIFGLLTGYRFVSFRIGHLMFVRQDGVMNIRRMSITGTGGQCLMAPPEPYSPAMPTQLYNYGGVIMNVLVALLAGLEAARASGVWQIFCVMLAVVGLFFALLNGVPMQTGLLDNDGRNAMHLRKDQKNVRAFWIQLKVNEEMVKGRRLKDLPQEWFEEIAPVDNILVGTQAAMRVEREMDAGRYEEARVLAEALLKSGREMGGYLTFINKCNLAYLYLTQETPDVARARGLVDKGYLKVQRQMMKQPATLRTMYAYRLIAEKDQKGAEEAMVRFDLLARTYPIQSEIEMERELLARVDAAAEQIKTLPSKTGKV